MADKTPEPDWLDTRYVAAKTQRHPASIRRWVKHEGLRAVKIRRGPLMIHRDELARFLAERSR